MTTTITNKFSNLKDKAAIRFINVLDRLRGDYEKEVVTTQSDFMRSPMTRQAYRKSKNA